MSNEVYAKHQLDSQTEDVQPNNAMAIILITLIFACLAVFACAAGIQSGLNEYHLTWMEFFAKQMTPDQRSDVLTKGFVSLMILIVLAFYPFSLLIDLVKQEAVASRSKKQ
jgi:hypothetical protein